MQNTIYGFFFYRYLDAGVVEDWSDLCLSGYIIMQNELSLDEFLTMIVNQSFYGMGKVSGDGDAVRSCDRCEYMLAGVAEPSDDAYRMVCHVIAKEAPGNECLEVRIYKLLDVRVFVVWVDIWRETAQVA